MTDYCTVAEVKAQIEKIRDTSDTEIAAMITAASRSIDNYCGRTRDGFVASDTAAARDFVGSGTNYQLIDECVAISTVAVKYYGEEDDDYEMWASTDWIGARGRPQLPTYGATPYTMILVRPDGTEATFPSGYDIPTVRVTARWGYAASVPDVVKQACIIQVARWFKRGQSGWADTVGSPETGTLLYQQTLDPAVKQLLISGRLVRPSLAF